jgi:predicted RNase H-like HicB family nuclease
MRLPAYPINVSWSDEDEAWVADVPYLGSCSALGDTPHEAVAELELALVEWLDRAKSGNGQGGAVPVRAGRHAKSPGWTSDRS